MASGSLQLYSELWGPPGALSAHSRSDNLYVWDWSYSPKATVTVAVPVPGKPPVSVTVTVTWKLPMSAV